MNFAIKSMILMVVLGGLALGIRSTLLTDLNFNHISAFLIGFWVLSVFIHWLTLRISKTAGDQFPNYYMGVIGIKMFSFLFVAFAYFALVGKEGRDEIFIALVCYLAFTFLEVISTINLLKRNAI